MAANNIYIQDMASGGEPTQVTTSGDFFIWNGVPDWGYEEEVLESASALWWSPNATEIAFLNFNTTPVQTFSFPIYDNTPYGEHEVLQYPVPGTTGSDVNLNIYNLKTKTTLAVNVSADGESMSRS